MVCVMVVNSAAAHAPTAPPPGSSRDPALSATTAESLVVVVAPANGRFHPATTEGVVSAGETVGHLAVGQGRRVEVRSPAELRVHGLLTRPGQLVTTGHGLLWGHRPEYQPA